MVALDWVLLAIMAASALFGALRGFVGALASLVAWLLAGWVAFRFGGQAARIVAGGAEPGIGELFAGYALSFIAVLLVVGIVGWLARRLVHSVGLSGVDRGLGFALGVARGALVCCVLLLLLGMTAMPREPEWRASQVLPVLLPGAQRLRGWLPEWVAVRVDLHGNGAAPGLAPPGMEAPVELPLPVPAGA